MKLLKKLSEVAGVPGCEDRVRELIKKELEPHVDSLEEDALGNLIAVKKSSKRKPKRVMMSAHMDEIGFYVKYIDEEGFIRVQNVGGFDTRNLFARQVIVHGSLSSSGKTKGKDLIGVMNPATKPIHIATPEERKKIPEMADFAVDLGLPADDIKKHVRIGDMVTLRQTFEDLGKIVTGKALDDRAGCWVQIETLKRLEKPAYDVYAVFSVQEEVGLRGAMTGAFSVEPDIGIALDTTLSVDTPRSYPDQSVTKMGEGVAIKVMDSASISTRWLVDDFIATAEKNDISYQLEILPLGGTDAGAIQKSRAGVPSITLSIPSRYVHTVTEMVAKDDLNAAVDLLVAYLS